TTRTPREARAMAALRPRPRFAPVTKAILSIVMNFLHRATTRMRPGATDQRRVTRLALLVHRKRAPEASQVTRLGAAAYSPHGSRTHRASPQARPADARGDH